MVGTFIWTPENYLHAKYYLKTGLRPPKITESQWKRLHPRFKNLKLEKNVLVSGNKVILPDKKDIRDKIMMKYYLDPELNCQDPLRFWERLSERYIGLSVNEVRAFLQNQRAYQIVKRRPTHRERAITPIITDHRNQQIQCDFIVYGKDIKSHNSNNSYIFTVIDHFSKRAWAYPMKSRDQKLFVDILHIIFDENGFPTTLHADNEFKGGLLEQFLKENYVRLASSEPYHPQSHGCIERFNQTLRRDLKRMQILYDSKKWSDLVQKCVDNYNN